MSTHPPISIDSEAVRKNKSLFQKYAQKIHGLDPNDYVQCVLKLAHWLNNYKAYYTDARPDIFNLLSEIQAPFNVLSYPGNPMVQAYTTLLKTVEPFLHLFEERYRQPIKDFLLPTITGSTSTTLPLSSEIQSAAPNVSSSTYSSPKNKIEKVGILKTEPEEIAQMPSAISAVPSKTMQTEASRLPSERTNKSITPVASFSKTKAKKKKNIDLSLLIQHDIEGLLEKKRSHSTIPGDTEPSATAAHSTPAPERTQIETTFTDAENISWDFMGLPQVNNASQQDDFNVASTIPKDQSITQPPVTTFAYENEEHIMDIEQTSKPVPIDQMVPPAHVRDENARKPMSPEQMDVTGIHPSTEESISMNIDSAQIRLERINLTDSPKISVTNVIHSDPIGLSLDSDQGQSDQGTDGIFGTEMRVVARQQGLKEKSRISVEFEIPETQYQLVLKWINSSQDFSSSICLTLGCYLTSELVENAEKAGCMTFEAQVSSTRSKWPGNGGLAMNANFNNSREEFPLSPPFQVTPENLVDISPFLVPGNNVIQLNQRQDLSQYTFVLLPISPLEPN
ncbi:hypothetical protein CPB84DRAFT_573924 [Gymnopilus junonius]|uniref:Uncharacterized protein n=1 Tax=Gymnopilus junonius TaxID=109634 RepID=A0A9P5N9S5_GYMJU|nr:hypothetical protein CPB84DRAFT_573924 [Gymnopilus junonius]